MNRESNAIEGEKDNNVICYSVASSSIPSPSIASSSIPNPNIAASSSAPNPSIAASSSIPNPSIAASSSIPNPSIAASSSIPNPIIAGSSSIPTDQQYGKLDAAAGDGTAALLNELSKPTVGSTIGESTADGNNEVKERPAKRTQMSPDVGASLPDYNKVSVTHINDWILKKTKHIVPMKNYIHILS